VSSGCVALSAEIKPVTKSEKILSIKKLSHSFVRSAKANA
jgi:hypothetical protein